MTRWPGATWCDVCRDGRVVAVVGDEIHTRTAGADLSGFVATVPEPLGWLRAEVNNTGALACVGQGQSGQGWLWSAAGGWFPLGQTFGVSPLEIVDNTLGWIVWMQTAADRYDVLLVGRDGDVIDRTSYAMSPTATGFLDAQEDSLLFTDQARQIGGVMLPNKAGPYLVGQDPTRDQLVLADLAGTPLRVLAEGAPIWEPRGTVVAGELVAASRSDDDGAVVVRGRPDDFPVWTPVPTPEPQPPTPPVEPPTEEPMSTPQAIIALMVAAGEHADVTHPGLRARDADAWMQIAAGYACAKNANVGRKSTTPTSRISPDTMGCLAPGSPGSLYAVSIIRDNPDGGNEWRATPLDHGLVRQTFHAVPPIPWEQTPEPPVEPPVEPPGGDILARVAALERWRVEVASYVVRTATGWPR